jgi:hypothetical protein
VAKLVIDHIIKHAQAGGEKIVVELIEHFRQIGFALGLFGALADEGFVWRLI